MLFTKKLAKLLSGQHYRPALRTRLSIFNAYSVDTPTSGIPYMKKGHLKWRRWK